MSKVMFVHPDLGIGGAEKLVVDAALALKKKGHSVSIITAHHDPNHCFPETSDGTLNVEVAGDWLPRSTCGKFSAFWAYLRMIYVSIYFVWFRSTDFDIAFVDQVSACIPFLHLKGKKRIIFYCHYPDQLLTKRESAMKRTYRYIIDTIEEYTTKQADVILVNSEFTKHVFQETFRNISSFPKVLYPTINFESFDKVLFEGTPHARTVFLSLNRFERKKNIYLCLYAMALLRDSLEHEDFQDVHLVIAGGYDDRVTENIEHYKELNDLCRKLNLHNSVTFYKSPSNSLKISLLKEATCLLYTPEKEHFGIVPVEAMYVGTPVIAVNSGGPLETVKDGETGFLRPQTSKEFHSVMFKFISGEFSKRKMSEKCRKHVKAHFSCEKFASDLDLIVRSVMNKRID